MEKNKKSYFFEAFAAKLTRASGKPLTFLIACTILIIWGLTGPIFNYSDTWQLVINTATSLITFLMVFIIQQTQNKDTMALQLKLNELIASTKTASNRLIDVEDLSAEELELIKEFYIKLSKLAQKEDDIKKSHSIEEADNIHKEKLGWKSLPKNKTDINIQ